jgi:hypothetical protein
VIKRHTDFIIFCCCSVSGSTFCDPLFIPLPPPPPPPPPPRGLKPPKFMVRVGVYYANDWYVGVQVVVVMRVEPFEIVVVGGCYIL